MNPNPTPTLANVSVTDDIEACLNGDDVAMPMPDDVATPIAPPRHVPPARITVVETVYHQCHGQEPTCTESMYARSIDTDEQVYARRSRIGSEWVSLDAGWIGIASALTLSNLEGRDRTVSPTPDEARATAGRVIEVGVMLEIDLRRRDMHAPIVTHEPIVFAVVRPGESLRLEPFHLDRLHVRCRTDVATMMVHAFPG